ncbi:hypothetical protein Tco_0977762 [Tanacetum coccineum]|uniref:Uncharacterized protein n=1 Tax=Tanacetum coccineum TaxID=301880 RepID=A0ABQ5EL35_9ASTR
MDDLNITMEEYIRLEEEKAQRHGRTFNWQTATYGKMKYCKDKDDSFTNFKTEYPAIVFDYTSDTTLSCEPMVSPLNNNEINFKISFDESDDEDYMVIFDENLFSYKIIYVDNLKTDSENENDKVNMPSSPSPEPTIGYIDDLDFFKDFENEFLTIAYNDDLKSKSDPLIEPSVSSRHIDKFETSLSEYDEEEQNILYFNDSFPLNIWHLYHIGIRGTHSSDTMLRDMARILYTAMSRSSRRYRTLGDRLSMVYTRDKGQELFTSHVWRRLFEIRAPLVREFILEFLSTCRISDTEMGLDVANTLCFQLGGPPSYVFIRDLVRRLCHRMIAFSIFGRGQAHKKVTSVDLFYLRSMDRGTANVPYLLAQYLFRHAEGRKSGASLSGGHFIGRHAAYFGLVSDQGLRGLLVVTSELPLIDLDELGRLNICLRVGNTWAWAPQPPPPAPRTIQQRVSRLEEEVQELRRSIVGLRGDVVRPITDQSRFITWMVSCMTQLMDASSHTYQAFDSTLVGSSQLPYQRRTRRRTSDASTSAPQQPDP